MAVKSAEYMSVESAENFILQHEKSAKNLYNRYLRDIKARKLTFEAHNERSSTGYQRLSNAVEISKKGFSAESLSYLAYTLASKQTSYSDFLSLRKKTLETLNAQFSEYKINKEGELKIAKKFLKNYKELQEFTDFMELVREQHLDKMFSSYQLINNIAVMIKESGKKETWADFKKRFENSSDRMKEAIIIMLGN